MQPSKKRTALLIAAALLCIFALGFAVWKASPFDSPDKPKVTQQDVKNELAQNQSEDQKTEDERPSNDERQAPRPTANPTPVPTAPSPTSPANPSQPLARTGPEAAIPLFLIAAALGYCFRLRIFKTQAQNR